MVSSFGHNMFGQSLHIFLKAENNISNIQIFSASGYKKLGSRNISPSNSEFTATNKFKHFGNNNVEKSLCKC